MASASSCPVGTGPTTGPTTTVCVAGTASAATTSVFLSATTTTAVAAVADAVAVAVAVAAGGVAAAVVLYAGVRLCRNRRRLSSLYVKYRDVEKTECPSVSFEAALEACSCRLPSSGGVGWGGGVMVDTRSPKEYHQAHVIDAVSVPLMSDYQRHVVGWTYRQRSRQAAINAGKAFFAPAVDDFLASFDRYRQTGTVVYVYCWRGGMRSRIVVNLLNMNGLRAVQVRGGFKAYMNDVVWKGLEQLGSAVPGPNRFGPKLIVLFGNTGTRKTELLHALQARNDRGGGGHKARDNEGIGNSSSSNNNNNINSNNEHCHPRQVSSPPPPPPDGIPVLDLEGLAGHRGSLFGGVGAEPRSQKQFSILLYHRLRELRHHPYVLVEGEAHKIGNAYLPRFLSDRITGDNHNHNHNHQRNHVAVLVTASLETRVACIRGEYFRTDGSVEQIREVGRQDVLVQNVGAKRMQLLHSMLDAGDYDGCIEWFLVHYYDVRYRFGKKGYSYALHVCSDDLDRCCADLLDFHRRLLDEGEGFLDQEATSGKEDYVAAAAAAAAAVTSSSLSTTSAVPTTGRCKQQI